MRFCRFVFFLFHFALSEYRRLGAGDLKSSVQNTCAIFLWWGISWMGSLRDHKHSETPLQCSDYAPSIRNYCSAYDDLHSQTSPNLHNRLAYLVWHCPSRVLGIFHPMPFIQGYFPCSGIFNKFPEIFLRLWPVSQTR